MVVLVTGAAKGIGRETARVLAERGETVIVGARDGARAQQVADELGARAIELDVTDDASVAAAVETVGSLDVLVNNAGISGGMVPIPEVTPELVERVFATNVVGIVRVTQAFTPLLRQSANPVIVNVSSGMGSIGITSDPERLESTLVGLQYPASKAAVNMLTTQYAKALPEMRVNCVDPGYTATDFNRHSGHKTVEQGADVIVQMALLDSSGPTGTYVDDQGTVPW